MYNTCIPICDIVWCSSSSESVVNQCVSSWSVEDALQRWETVIKVFAHIFLAEGPGNERDNFLNPHAGFASRMARCVVLGNLHNISYT